MKRKTKLLTWVISTIIICVFIAFSVNAQVKLTEKSPVFINGIGSIRVGMTVKEASQIGGVKLIQTGSGGEEYGCLYFQIKKPKGISFMVIDSKIARIDITENKQIATAKSAHIGDSESRIKSLYPGQIKVTSHQYVEKGHYLTFVPKDNADKNYRIVFETDGKRVTRFRSGKLPEVEYIEGCL